MTQASILEAFSDPLESFYLGLNLVQIGLKRSRKNGKDPEQITGILIQIKHYSKKLYPLSFCNLSCFKSAKEICVSMAKL